MIYSGKFKVTSPFGQRTLNGKPDDHKGIDVVGITDKHVCAVVGGRVVTSKIVTDKSNRTWEWGNFVCILGDDGRMYYYCHLSKRLVSVGRRVEAGQHFGIEGNTGYSFGSHCHFEVRENGVSIDPAPFLGIPNRTVHTGRTGVRRYRRSSACRRTRWRIWTSTGMRLICTGSWEDRGKRKEIQNERNQAEIIQPPNVGSGDRGDRRTGGGVRD